MSGLILTVDKPSGVSMKMEDTHASEESIEDQIATGPRGGKLFTDHDFSVELTIFEKGVPPQFRVYLYEKGKLLPPTSAAVAITLTRLGAPAQLFRFTPEADYLLGDQIVEEPHSFDLAIAVEHDNKLMRWSHSQIEGRVEIPDEMLKSMGIELLTAGAAIIKPKLRLPGEVIFNEHNIVRVVPRVPGMVSAVHAHHGQHVKKMMSWSSSKAQCWQTCAVNILWQKTAGTGENDLRARKTIVGRKNQRQAGISFGGRVME